MDAIPVIESDKEGTEEEAAEVVAGVESEEEGMNTDGIEDILDVVGITDPGGEEAAGTDENLDGNTEGFTEAVTGLAIEVARGFADVIGFEIGVDFAGVGVAFVGVGFVGVFRVLSAE
jgi:hypothetical protein